MVRVYVEEGRTWTFACAIDWPGWARRGKDAATALEALQDYARRYRPVAGRGFQVRDVEVEIVGRVRGTATTDFGVPAALGPWDDEPMDAREVRRQLRILDRAWASFDETVASAPASLRKGPRGGGRDRYQIVEHVRDAERAYGRKFGVRVPPRTPWEEQRKALLTGLERPGADAVWKPRYAIRRIAWHVLDHTWEIEDKSA